MPSENNIEKFTNPEGKIVLPPLEQMPSSLEKEPGLERAQEKKPERKPEEAKSRKESFKDVLAKAKQSAPAMDTERVKEIDNILEDGLGEIFLKMDPAKQKEFKAEGEKAVRKIDKILGKAKINTQKIFKIIKVWLARVPGINKFFLEQEAKIKTDKIMRIKL